MSANIFPSAKETRERIESATAKRRVADEEEAQKQLMLFFGELKEVDDVDNTTYHGTLSKIACEKLRTLGYSVRDDGDGVASVWCISW